MIVGFVVRLCYLLILLVYVLGLFFFYFSVGLEYSECILGFILCLDFCVYGGFLVILECNVKCLKFCVNYFDLFGFF